MESRIAVGAEVKSRESRRNGDGNIRALFQNADCTGRKPAPIRRCHERQFAEPCCIRRIGEQELKRLHRRGWACSVASASEFARASQAECLDVFPHRAPGIGIVFDKEAVGRAARQCFEAERTGPREQIEHARALDAEVLHPVREDIEEGLANPVRCGARIVPAGADIERPRKRPPTILTAYPHRFSDLVCPMPTRLWGEPSRRLKVCRLGRAPVLRASAL